MFPFSHPDDLWTLQDVIRMPYDIGSISSGWLIVNGLCHPEDLRYRCMSSGRHNVIWALSHPDELAPDRISSGWLMVDALCFLDDLAGVGISSGWITANSLSHPWDGCHVDQEVCSLSKKQPATIWPQLNMETGQILWIYTSNMCGWYPWVYFSPRLEYEGYFPLIQHANTSELYLGFLTKSPRYSRNGQQEKKTNL